MITQPARAGLTPDLAGRKVRLREIGPADRRTLIGFDRETSPQVGGYRHWAAHRAGFGDTGDARQFAIETLRGGLLVGSVWTTQADPMSGRFSYGIGIGPQHRRCGYAGDAIVVLLGFMFGQCHYRKCEVSIYGGNLSSLSLHGGLGFREEDRVRDTEVRHGEIKYVVRMGVTAHEFTARHLAVEEDLRERRRGRHARTRRGRHWSAQYVR